VARFQFPTYCPVPLSAIVCGEFPAVSVMVTAAVNAPVAVGPKCPWMVQVAPAAMLVPQVFANRNDDAFVPVTAMLVNVSVAVPLLVSVTVCDPLVEPTATVPNERLVAESVTPAPWPVPVSAIICGDPTALSVIATAPASAPPVTGSKFPLIVQLAPAATLVPQVFVKTNEVAFAPVTAIWVIVSADCPLLVNVTDCDAVAVPTGEEPNDRLVAERVAVGPSPVPLRATVCGEPPALSVMVIVAVSEPFASGLKCP